MMSSSVEESRESGTTPDSQGDNEGNNSKDPAATVLLAAEKNDLQLLRNVLATDPSLVNAHDSDGYTPLHRACYNGHLLVVKFLLDNGADVGAKTADGWQPIHCATNWNNAECVGALIAAGADINATTNGGQSPLHLAAANKHARDTLELLLWQTSLDPSKVNGAGDLPQELAARTGELGGLFEMIEPSVNCLY